MLFQTLGRFQAQAAPQALFLVPLLRLHSDHAVCTLDKLAHQRCGFMEPLLCSGVPVSRRGWRKLPEGWREVPAGLAFEKHSWGPVAECYVLTCGSRVLFCRLRLYHGSPRALLHPLLQDPIERKRRRLAGPPQHLLVMSLP